MDTQRVDLLADDQTIEGEELEQVAGGRMVIPGNHTAAILAMKYGLPPPPPGGGIYGLMGAFQQEYGGF